MAWKWYEIDSYIASVGSSAYYANVQLVADGFYGNLKFHKEGPLPDSNDPVVGGTQRFYGHLDYEQLPAAIDMLRNEKPVKFGFNDAGPNFFRLMTGTEAVGEGDGELVPDSD